MERRERYDPEDLEHLLQERDFDELLEEERAFVLRHLSGREEYESMRLLLHAVQRDERDHPPVEADPVVRERVLAVFRAQQRPQWSIWLNSVKAVFWPEKASAFWKPALAFGTVAVVVTTAVIGLRSGPAPENAVAEVRQEQQPAVPAVKNGSEKAEALPSPAPSGAVSDPASGEASSAFTPQEPRPAPTPASADGPTGWAQAAEVEAAAPEAPPMVLADVEHEAATGSAMGDSSSRDEQERSFTLHTVTADELARNESVANMSGVVSRQLAKDAAKTESRAKKERARVSEERTADDAGGAQASTDATALVGLLRAAW